MKNFFLLITFLFSVLFVHGQNVKVSRETVKLKGEAAEGFEVEVDGTLNDVQSQLAKYLKPIGKIKKGQEADAIALPVINGKNYNAPVYVLARDKGKGVAWIGVLASEWPAGIEQITADIQKLVYDFGVTFQKDKIQAQIDESTRALQAVERQQQKLVNQEKDFTTRLGDNRNEKIQLEKALENNKIQFDALTRKLEQNKKDQDSVAVAAEQIRKVIEMQKEKQRNVN